MYITGNNHVVVGRYIIQTSLLLSLDTRAIFLFTLIHGVM